jgi:acetyl-CoA acetyltransferase
MESMSQAPHVIRGARSGFALGQGKLEDSLMVALLDTYCNTPMAGTAENLARKFEISREEQDKYALRSQQEAKRAKDAGVFAEEIVAVEVKTRKGSVLVNEDDHPRPETTLEGSRRICHGWKRFRHCRWCCGAGDCRRRVCQTARSEADGPNRELGVCGRRA